MDAPSYFERARGSAARRWEQLDADPELAAPWRQLFLQVQSPRHVVSELLQNADDAGATEAEIRIDAGTFVFEHNGRDFREDEFSSLCRFGYSNKRSLHTIGHRGIGFKSTFSLGDSVELVTPTLSVAFHRDQFTLPKWIDRQRPMSGRTRISVTFTDERRQRELQANIDDWAKNVVSLLFFRNIRALKIDGKSIRWESLGAGPPDNSEWFQRSDERDSRVLLIRAEEEAFPGDALAEIRQERMLTDAELLEFPSSTVEIVVGAKGELFVVLPTRVATRCPFASNAPFIQDPAREGIKDPNISPANRWLLDRIGRLAADSMLQWLNNTDLIDEERATAYDILPAEIDSELRPLDQSVAETIRSAFSKIVDEKRYVLGFGGQLHQRGAVVLVPDKVRDAWPDRDVASLFDRAGRVSLAACIASENAGKLVKRGAVEELPRAQILLTLQVKNVPKPRTWDELLSLWAYVTAGGITVRYGANAYRDLRIVPVQGEQVLHQCTNVVRLGETKLLQSDDDWEFLSPYLLCINPDWTRYLAEQRRQVDEGQERESESVIDRAYDLLRALNLGEGTDATRLIERVCVAMFEGSAASSQDAIHLAWIAAKVNVNVGHVMKYVTLNGSLEATSETLVFDRDGTMPGLLPDDWCEKHGVSARYLDRSTVCSTQEFLEWAAGDRSGLFSFVPPQKVVTSIWSRSDVTTEMRRRGVSAAPEFRYKSNWFELQDWDYPEDLWAHWATVAMDDPEIYAKVLDRILSTDLHRLWERSQCRIQQISQAGYQNLVYGLPMVPSWVIKIREFPCLRDTNGIARKPSELMRRTEATEPFLGIDPFVHRSFDVEAAAPVLDLLGVQTQPANPDKILERIRALSFSSNPPVAELGNLYRRLDMICASCSTGELTSIRQNFEFESLIFTESKEWKTSRDVFIVADEEDVPGASVIASSVRDLSMWPRIGVAQHPTLGLAIEWLNRLPRQTPLDAGTRKRVRALLARHPNEIWGVCGHWLTLNDEWGSVADLRWYLSMQSLVPRTHLFSHIRSKVADFQMLSTQHLAAPPFSELPTLASRIREEISRDAKVQGAVENQEWLHELGRVLVYAQFEDPEVTERTRALAMQLAKTVMMTVDVLEAIPYIDGVPAGTKRKVNALWSGFNLYVTNRSPAKLAADIVTEIARFFDRSDIADALRICFERSADFIEEYIEENFILSDELPGATVATATAKDTSSSAGGATKLDNPIAPTALVVNGVAGRYRDDEPSAEAAEAAIPEARRHASRKVDLFERFALSQGFEKTSDHRYEAADGRSFEKMHESIFPWKLRSPDGYLVNEYWALDRSIDRGSIEVPSEVWELIQKRPDSTVLILADLMGAPVVLGGRKIVELHHAGDLMLYPASYRIQKKPE